MSKGHVIKLLENLGDEKALSSRLNELVEANMEAFERSIRRLEQKQGISGSTIGPVMS